MKKRRVHQSESMSIGNVAAHVSEFFTDYVVIARVKGGLVWRFSDRTFAQGAIRRLSGWLDHDDIAHITEESDEHNR